MPHSPLIPRGLVELANVTSLSISTATPTGQASKFERATPLVDPVDECVELRQLSIALKEQP